MITIGSIYTNYKPNENRSTIHHPHKTNKPNETKTDSSTPKHDRSAKVPSATNTTSHMQLSDPLRLFWHI